MGVWAVVPVKELDQAKERLAPVLPPERRRALMLAMLEDVLAALAATPGLGGLAIVTVDAAAWRLAAATLSPRPAGGEGKGPRRPLPVISLPLSERRRFPPQNRNPT